MLLRSLQSGNSQTLYKREVTDGQLQRITLYNILVPLAFHNQWNQMFKGFADFSFAIRFASSGMASEVAVWS